MEVEAESGRFAEVSRQLATVAGQLGPRTVRTRSFRTRTIRTRTFRPLFVGVLNVLFCTQKN